MSVERSSPLILRAPALGAVSWRLGFGFAWTLTIILGGAVAGGIFPLPASWGDVLSYAASGLLAGVISGTLQAFQLRGLLPRPWRWVVATSVGTLLIGFAVGITVAGDPFPGWYDDLRRWVPFDGFPAPEWALAAVLAVLAQAMLLRGRVRLVGLWAAVCVAGWMVGLTWIGNIMADSIAEGILPTDRLGVLNWDPAQIYAAGSAIGGGIAATALAALLLRPQRSGV